jgi:hypothetical protein
MTLVAQKDRIERRELNMSLEKFCRKPLIKISPDTASPRPAT